MARGCVHGLKDLIRRVDTSMHMHSATFLSCGETCSRYVGDAAGARVGWEEDGRRMGGGAAGRRAEALANDETGWWYYSTTAGEL